MSIVQLSVLQSSYAQEIELNVNKRVFSPSDTLVAFGRSLPNDALIVELFNPAGRLVLPRAQIDVGVEGSYSRIILVWPSPDMEKFRLGTYTLVVRSSSFPDLRATEALVFQSVPGITPGVERELDVDISIPFVIGKGETATLVVQVTLNGVLVKGEPEEALNNSYIRFPDGTSNPLSNFTAIDDGIYLAEFMSDSLGPHTIHVRASHQGLVSSAVAGVQVEEGPVLSLGNEIARLNANIEDLRQETAGNTADISESVSEIGSAAGQVTSLLLPIIGMIAIIVALQATILARRK